MELYRGTIRLQRIKQEDIELVRQWRNSAEVARYMEYREYITPDMQQQWFRSVDNDDHLYFLLLAEGLPIGLIYGAGINWDSNEVANAGIFIAREEHRESRYALEASLLLNDFAFAIGMQRIYIKVLADNKRAIAYNKLLGYRRVEDDPARYNQQYSLDRISYLLSRKKLEAIIPIERTFQIEWENIPPVLAARIRERLSRGQAV